MEELIKVNVPTLGGLRLRSYTSASHSFTLNGECDTTSRALEYSYDNSSWRSFASSCPAGTFSLPLTLTLGVTTIYVRARGKFTATDSSVGRVRFIPAPSSPLLTFVGSSRSDSSDRRGYGTQNALGDFATGFPPTGGDVQMNTYVPGVVYSEN